VFASSSKGFRNLPLFSDKHQIRVVMRIRESMRRKEGGEEVNFLEIIF